MDVFSDFLMSDFIHSTLVRIRKKYPAQTNQKLDDELNQIIRKGISKAESYGIEEHEDTRIYIEYMIFFGEDFDTNPETSWARKVLKIRNLNGHEKINRMLEEYPLTEEVQSENEFE